MRLKEVYEAKSDDDLAKKLGVGLRSIGSWKAGAGMAYATTVDLLHRAGWLMTEEPAAMERAEIRRAAELAAEARRLAEEARRRRSS